MTDELCSRWIVEYDCWRIWTKFLASGSVDGIPNRLFSAYSPQEAENAGSTYGCRLLISFMCKISEAANDVGGVNTGQTTLEDAIDVLNQISRCYGEVLERDQLKEALLCLKQQAVLAPLRNKDRAKAKEVFDRQWRHWKNSDELKCRDKLMTLLNTDDVAKKRLRSFNEVVVKCQDLLEKIMSSLSKPFLVQAAEKTCHEVEAKKAVQQPEHTSAAKPATAVKNYIAVASNDCVVMVDKMSEKEKQKSVECPAKQTDQSAVSPAKQTSHSAEAAKSTAKQIDQSTASVKSPSKQSGQSDMSVNSPAKETGKSTGEKDSNTDTTKCNSAAKSTSNNSESEVEISDTSDSDSFMADDQWRPRKHPKRRAIKRAWSHMEEELVYKGVQKHGLGNWAQIHANFLRDRSNVDIKDKWRTMCRQGRLTQLAKKFGPMPLL